MQALSIYEPVQRELARVEETLREASRVDGFPVLAEVADYVLDRPGKRIRPLVTLICSQFHPHDPEPVVLMATAVEMLHIATLVHDDTVDDARVRRGRPTVSSRWGKGVAVLVGDYIFAKSATLASQAGNMRVIRLFAETVMALSAGELRELVSSYSWEQSREDYWRRIREKTASLFSAAAECGAVLSGAPERQVQALRSYGLNLGMAFQIVDDILDFSGSEEVIGKPVGSDLTQGVMTLPAILLAERYPNDASVRKAFDGRPDPLTLKAAVEMIRNSSIIPEAAEIAEGFSVQARQALAHLPDMPARRSLTDLAEYVARREK